MKDFLTKRVSTNHLKSTGSALDTAYQLRNELFDKLGTFKKSPKSNDLKTSSSLGSSKFKNLQISTDYPSIDAQVGHSYYSRFK